MSSAAPFEVDVTTKTTHTVTVTAPEGEHFVVTYDQQQMATGLVMVEVITDAHRTLATVGTKWSAPARELVDGTPTGRLRWVHGTNLGRVPVEVRLAVQEALRDHVGRLEDPADQLNGL